MTTLFIAVYPSSENPSWDRIGGWSGSPVFTTFETSIEETGVQSVDVSMLSELTTYKTFVVWDDGENSVGPVASSPFQTLSESVSVSSSKEVLYNVLSSVSSSKTIQSLVNGSVSKDAVIGYGVRQSVSSSSQIGYNVRGSVSSSKTLSYVVRSQISSSKEALYNVRSSLNSNSSLSWSVRGIVESVKKIGRAHV